MWASPRHPKARSLPDHRQLRSFSLILLDELLAWALRRCCLKPDPFLHEGLEALTCCVNTDTFLQVIWYFPTHSGL